MAISWYFKTSSYQKEKKPITLTLYTIVGTVCTTFCNIKSYTFYKYFMYQLLLLWEQTVILSPKSINMLNYTMDRQYFLSDRNQIVYTVDYRNFTVSWFPVDFPGSRANI
jgi:hypothetical protein